MLERRSEIGAGLEIMFHIIMNTFLKSSECICIAGIPSALHIRFSEILVLVPNILRCRDVIDLRVQTQGMEHCRSKIVETACLSAADVEYPISSLPGEPELHQRNHVFHIDEIAHLLAILVVWSMRLKQVHFP